ncbi:hypothetical protein [Streptomyces monashensis]|uniref:Uncharacterized protein n=1 Tax=Streptomyces monashensis TaxID=1678012 RepID=A0A1S2QM92_9ACTN|nr:hypothetical protein [Streptomyces monashensis]OIK06773.1 hypothetical protein BIV23_07255 [Streptomyces monashensis]
MVIGVASVLSMSSLVAEGGSVFIPVGRFLGFVWLVVLSVLLWWRSGRTDDLTDSIAPRHL